MVGGTGRRLAKLKPENSINITMDGFQLKESEEKSEKLLGVKFQSNLKWHKQIQELQLKLKDRLTGLTSVRFIVAFPFRKTLAEGIFGSILTYCMAAWGGADKGDLQDLQVMQNRAAQLVLNLPPRSHRETMFSNLGWLTVNQLVFFHTVMAVYRIRKFQEPEYLAKFLSQDNFRKNIVVPNSNLTLAKRSFCYRGAESRNIVPEQVRSLEKLESFKREVRKWTILNVEKCL